uniref:WUSCHEL homeobox protein n=1 Tax=Pinus pinaster TaxID=71647 RepID=A0A2I4KAN7_PINPS|nr:WUSCHEL homeobox protein [Pinus pinaster]
MSSNKSWVRKFIRNPSDSSRQRTPQEGILSRDDESSTPDPKPRWNPKPEQVQILEEIFNSGKVNPPRAEIKRITTQLQEFGDVGEANVFYWFQNRKSRSKQKQRQQAAEMSRSSAESTKSDQSKPLPVTTTDSSTFHGTGESSSSAMPPASASFSTYQDNQIYRARMNEEVNINQRSYMPAFEAGRIMVNKETGHDSNYGISITILVNNREIEVPAGPINVRAVFGGNKVLVHSSGQPVLVNECGFTLQGLQHGAMYYLV